MATQLAALQEWMHAVVTHPDGVVAGASTERARSLFDTPPERFDEVVTASATLSARQRLEIYQHGYFRRLLDCLGEMLPVLRHALGGELFEQFALDYLDSNPSRSPNLARLDEDFVQHLRRSRPDRDLPPAEREDWPDFIIDLARLERGIRVTFDGPGVEGGRLLATADVDAWTDDELLGEELQPVPCLSLASFRFPVRRYLLAVRNGEDPSPPGPRDTHLAFNRRDFSVRLLELPRPASDLLSHLVSGLAVNAAGQHAGISHPDALRSWLLRFAGAGLFLPHTTPPMHATTAMQENSDD